MFSVFEVHILHCVCLPGNRLIIYTIHAQSTPLTISLHMMALIEMYHFFYIMKTRLYNFDPLKPHFYIVKLGFTGVYVSFFISAQNIDCGYSLEPPRRGGSNEYPQSMF